mmetsp:Transcript_3602/g.5515  ORF Transcript_3602/g.5515 Transcript_3602/m.5515 type:complete len:210 (-) Transcript_3602:186-815(-)
MLRVGSKRNSFFVPEESEWQLTAQMLSGREAQVLASAVMTLRELRDEIADALGVPAKAQSLMDGLRQLRLSESASLLEAGLANGSLLTVVCHCTLCGRWRLSGLTGFRNVLVEIHPFGHNMLKICLTLERFVNPGASQQIQLVAICEDDVRLDVEFFGSDFSKGFVDPGATLALSGVLSRSCQAIVGHTIESTHRLRSAVILKRCQPQE